MNCAIYHSRLMLGNTSFHSGGKHYMQNLRLHLYRKSLSLARTADCKVSKIYSTTYCPSPTLGPHFQLPRQCIITGYSLHGVTQWLCKWHNSKLKDCARIPIHHTCSHGLLVRGRVYITAIHFTSTYHEPTTHSCHPVLQTNMEYHNYRGSRKRYAI